MTTCSRSRRLLRPILAGALLVAGLTLAPVGGAPIGAAGLVWNVTVEVPATVTGPTVTVTGRATLLLGQVRTVRVRLVPRGELPASCGAAPEVTGPVTRGTYTLELRPGCNGPYRAEVVASGTDVLGRSVSSGGPARRDLALADPGPAPGAPAASAAAGGISVSWSAPPDPDVVGWTLVPDTGAPLPLPAGTTQALVPANAGDHSVRLVARRWGGDGPGGPEVSSPASGAASVHLDVVHLDPPDRPGGSGGNGGGGSGAAGPAAAGGAGGAGATEVVSSGSPRRVGGTVGRRGRASTSGSSSGRTPSSAGNPGYEGELPYGRRDGGSGPGDAAGEAEPGGEQVAVGAVPPAARVVRTTERIHPGLVVPFALAFVLFGTAIWLWSYLRRARRLTGSG